MQPKINYAPFPTPAQALFPSYGRPSCFAARVPFPFSHNHCRASALQQAQADVADLQSQLNYQLAQLRPLKQTLESREKDATTRAARLEEQLVAVSAHNHQLQVRVRGRCGQAALCVVSQQVFPCHRSAHCMYGGWCSSMSWPAKLHFVVIVRTWLSSCLAWRVVLPLVFPACTTGLAKCTHHSHIMRALAI